MATESDCMAPRLTDEGLRILDYATKGTSRPSSGAATGFVAGDWAHPSTIGYDADDDAPEGD